jgi:AcrR family transcriptional regulator
MYLAEMAGTAAGERRTQQDRSASTKLRLAQAAIASLVEQGWAATSVVEVCARAGVTRGAFHHHYDDLAELLADALRDLYDDLVARSGDWRDDLAGRLDDVWSALARPDFKAVIEVWLAMANDRELAVEIGPVVADFASLIAFDARSLPAKQRAATRTFYVLAREAMIGLALGRATNGGRALPHERAVLAELKRQARAVAS